MEVLGMSVLTGAFKAFGKIECLIQVLCACYGTIGGFEVAVLVGCIIH